MAHAQLVRNFRRASLALAIAAGPATAAALADQLPPPAAAGPCQQALERAGVEATEARLRALQSCAGASFRCVQEQPGSAACLARAHELCARELARAFDLAGQTAPACDALALADLLGDQGLGHAQLSCAPHGFTAVGSFADLAACVRDEQDCRAAEMLSIEFPRAWELLDLAGVAPSTIGCLDEGADGDGRGLAATARSGRLKKKDRVRTTAANGCQQAIASAGTTFARDYQKLLAGCLASAWTCLETGAGECWEAARQACAARFAARPEPGAALAARVGQVCGASAKKKQRVALPDLLDPSGLGFGALAERCARAGVPQLASVEDVGRCVELEHECATQRIVARQVPRAAELLAGAGLDPQQFPCLGAEISFVCGNTLAEEGEECDPPGSVGACGGGSLCNSLCECVDSRPPQLVVHPLVYTVPEGQPLSIGVAASDPDGERVVLTAAPALAGASFSATPGMAATGQFEFPPQSAPGLFLVTFTARDERGVTDQATVLIQVTNVNSAPEISVAPEALVDEGSVITIPVESGDPDGDLLTYTAAPLPPNATFVPATGTLSFAPDYEQAGIYDVTFQASDGTLLSNTATVRITVRDVAPGEPGETTGLILEVDRTPAVTLLQAQRVTGRVNPTTDTPEPERSTSSLVTGLSPAAAEQGLTLEVALTGHTTGELATHFVGGVSQASFGAGVTVVALDVRGPADAVASISIDPGAAIGPRQVMVVTRDETALSVLAFNVVAGHAAIHGTVVDADTGEPLAA
ncbi:MAG: hypothetical protein KBD01_20360, partial [Acidobacteria bacterium]|nr:hypothetical protein [Acidobacteriota bacterium]